MKLAEKVLSMYETKDFEKEIEKLMVIVNDKELNRKDADKFLFNSLKKSGFKKGSDYTQKEFDSLVGDLIDIKF